MTDVYTYSKNKSEVEKPINFTNSKNVIKIGVLPDEENDKMKPVQSDQIHALKNPNSVTISNFPALSENIVNTERISTQDAIVFHYEGGWPKDLDITDLNEQKKYIKKRLEKNADNQDKFTFSVKKMIEVVEKVISQNNEIDMYEEYFEGEEPQNNMENLNVKTLKLFKSIDQETKRSVTSLSWHPDGPHKIASSYSMLKFQSQQQNFGFKSYIWDINNPNVPCEVLNPPSPIIKLAYNHKTVDQLAFGCYSGLVGIWDLRQNKGSPAIVSEVEISHHEPVFDLLWLSSKGGNEFVTTSTDGKVIWWDSRNLSAYSDSLVI